MELATGTTTRFRHIENREAIQAAVNSALILGQIKRHMNGYTNADLAEVVTVCEIIDNNQIVATGYAFWVQSKERPYWNRKLGVAIARGRATKMLNTLNRIREEANACK